MFIAILEVLTDQQKPKLEITLYCLTVLKRQQPFRFFFLESERLTARTARKLNQTLLQL